MRNIHHRIGALSALAVGATLALSYAALNAPDEPAGAARLVAIQELPEIGDQCVWNPADQVADRFIARDDRSFAAFDNSAYAASPAADETKDLTRPPVRTIRDTYPIYSS